MSKKLVACFSAGGLLNGHPSQKKLAAWADKALEA